MVEQGSIPTFFLSYYIDHLLHTDRRALYTLHPVAYKTVFYFFSLLFSFLAYNHFYIYEY